MSTIDLGSKESIEVKYNGEAYELREPTLKDAQELQVKMKKDSEDYSIFTDFVVSLGMPKEVANSLGITKLKTLSDGILGSVEKK